MNLDTLISSDAVIHNNKIKSKKRALEILAEKLADETSRINRSDSSDSEEDEVESLQIFRLLTEREKLGSTGMGHGVALPHARTNLTDHATGAFLKIDNGIDFDSPDDQKTDLIFALMVPEHYTDEHLKILSHLATLFSDEKFCEQLRSSNDSMDTYNFLTSTQAVSEAS